MELEDIHMQRVHTSLFRKSTMSFICCCMLNLTFNMALEQDGARHLYIGCTETSGDWCEIVPGYLCPDYVLFSNVKVSWIPVKRQKLGVWTRTPYLEGPL